jgi:predicted ATPase
MLDRLGDRYRDLLSEHHRVMREAIAASSGREVATAGDSFFAVFSRAADAVDCARRAQRALAVAEWPGAEAPKVRMGIHTGSPEVEDGEYVGIDVHRAARVMAVANGGQVLLTEEARRACGSAVEVRDLGYHRLKDLPAPEHLVQLLVPGVGNRFAPLRSLNRSNLPSPANALVGRRAEVARALELLAAEDGRLLTLLGPGGVGKTRLAVEVAAEAATRYRDGVWLEALATIPDRALMVSELARLLEVDPAPGQSLVQTLLEVAAERELLLVLDNFEHLLPAADVVADLLAAAPGIEILATSREPLRVRGEHRMQVAPLALEDAAELFLVRARAARPELSLNEQDRAAVERICVRLDGLPLALELAAARVAVFAPARLEARLAERLGLPAGPRDLPERQQTLRATIDWSYRLLEPGERELFASFSPFIGGVRVDCAEALWGAEGAERLISLGEKSLLRRREDPDGEPRFWMLETVREFALERAAAEHSAAEATARHTDYFFTLVAQAAPYLLGPGQREWLDRLEHEHANLRAALDQLAEHDPARAMQMVSNLAWFWDIRGYVSEAERRLNDVLASAPLDGPGRARALCAAGRITQLYLGEPADSEPFLQEALACARREGNDRVAVQSLSLLAYASEARGDLVEMAAQHEEAIALARASGDDWALGSALNSRAISPSNRADLDLYISRLEEALEVTRSTGDAFTTAIVTANLAETVLDNGDVDRAESLKNEALARAREIDFRWLIGVALILAAAISLEHDQCEDARQQLREAIATTKYQVEDTALVASLAGTLAAIERTPAEAAKLWGAAENTRRVIGVSETRTTARLRTRWQPQAVAAAREKASWDDAWKTGTDLTLDEAVALAATVVA